MRPTGDNPTFDAQDSQLNFTPVQRMTLFLKNSLQEKTQFAVFEPNAEPLWAQIRLSVGAFMHGLFLEGAFVGGKPADAYFVKCDSDTNSQTDIDNGLLTILVGFAPLKPAEFVVLTVHQLVGAAGP